MVDKSQHPSAYIRANVIPKSVNVTKAAELLGVSRPTLSNLLNGNADLSREMAARLEGTFGASARDLLDLQSAWDASRAKETSRPTTIKAFVPPFLELKASKIEQWSSRNISARQRLSVLLRTLVNSTGVGLTTVDFPGNDDSERPGWDGLVEAAEGTPWIPQGRSGWEFGVNQDAKAKADKDFAKSVRAVPVSERQAMTFVFVTPKPWPRKGDWVRDRKAEGHWKDVVVHDASSLEQWLEQSIPAQVWFANETGQNAQGAISLDEAWKIWTADCNPPLLPSLFEDALAAYRSTLKRAVLSGENRPIIISADSRDEALAFLSAGFSADDPELGSFRDRIVVFHEPGVLTKLAAQASNFIPVIHTREVEKEFAPHRSAMPSFIIYPRNATADDPDITLETLGYEAFDKALGEMGCEHDRIQQLGRETGRSPTVLRRRLSNARVIREPDWAHDRGTARQLIPFLLAGAWNVDNPADRSMLEALAGDIEFDELERQMGALLPLDASPVWWVGSLRGIVSKIDVLFAIKDVFSNKDLERFFTVADLVLSEEDPALDLEEDKRWAAGIYGKTREISSALRDGIAESLVLLSVYGNQLFKPRLTFEPAAEAEKLVRSILGPMTATVLESQSDDMPLYSEAAPEVFLSLVEADLEKAEPETIKLMRPVGDALFGRYPRTGLLWALENLAWSERLFMRAVLVLARLAETVLEDNLANKPSASLSSIFRSWMPQTSADLECRKLALKRLAERFPHVAWPICIEQFEAGSRIGHYSHKPRWRPDGHGKGNVVTVDEIDDFARFAFHMALNWPQHTLGTITALVANLDALDESLRIEVWDTVDRWAETASEPDRASLREAVRTSAFTRRAMIRGRKSKGANANSRAQCTFDRLEPRDPVLRHQWLFRNTWIDETADELEDADLDLNKRDARIAAQRMEAIGEIFENEGVDGILRLAEMGQAQPTVGVILARTLADEGALSRTLANVMEDAPLTGTRASVVGGALAAAADSGWNVVGDLVSGRSPEVALSILLVAPFQRSTWTVVDSLGLTAEYWGAIEPSWSTSKQDIQIAVLALLAVERPRAAFAFARLDLKSLQPRALFSLLQAIVRDSSEAPGTYLLNDYDLRKAFALLNESGQMSTDEMAGLEFAFIDVFDEERGCGIVNLERQIEASPELFAEALSFVYKRDDRQEDDTPDDLTAEVRSRRATQAYKMLDKLRGIPGHNDEGALDAQQIVNWVQRARSACAAVGRVTMGDQTIGQLLSHAAAAEDGIWPCEPVRDALELVLNEQIGLGLQVALRNSRGAHWRGEGGDQERELAAKYGRWAREMEYTHPRLAAALHAVEDSYLREAEQEDNEARISRRMRF